MTPNYREDENYDVIEEIKYDKKTRQSYWTFASSLQEVDNLHVSDYAEEQAQRYIEGNIKSSELEENIKTYYQNKTENDSSEADLVASNIVRILETNTFLLKPSVLFAIHKELFTGVFDESIVGKARTVNLSKKEAVLGGNSVTYADYSMIDGTLEYDFEVESKKRYTKDFNEDDIKNFSRFISNIWQTHPFREGNTRTTAVFSELYLRSLGISVTNEPFANNGKLFRDALVRANYYNWNLNVDEEPKYLESFYRSVIFHEPYPYNNSDLNIHGIRVDNDIEIEQEGNENHKLTSRDRQM